MVVLYTILDIDLLMSFMLSSELEMVFFVYVVNWIFVNVNAMIKENLYLSGFSAKFDN